MCSVWRRDQLVVLVALAILLLAMAHPLMHALCVHAAHDGDGCDHCALCQIFATGALIAAPAIVLTVVAVILDVIRVVPDLSYEPCGLARLSSRGPPL